MSIEENYSIGFVAALALREKQIQQVYRPIIAVHKWFARRPGTLFRGLILSEFAQVPVQQSYYQSHGFEGITVADCFMGGGSPLLEANRVGCNVIGTDINPMATWIVREEIDALDMAAYEAASVQLLGHLQTTLGHLYKTKCPISGRADADLKYGLWVKVGSCGNCARDYDLFQEYVIADDTRHPAYVIACHSCGDLHEVSDPKQLGTCHCGAVLRTEGNVKRSKAVCSHCGHVNSAPFRSDGPPRHRLFAMEYYNGDLKNRPGRCFKRPDGDDLARVAEAQAELSKLKAMFVPDDAIPGGDETDRLLRWGYRRFNEVFNGRQLLALEITARWISKVADPRIKRALATNFSDLIRYQNMLCRYDTMALKSLDIFSIHGFPASYVQCESNFLGIRNASGTTVGSGGWVNITEKYAKAKRFCTAPFEVAFSGKKKTTIPIQGEWIGETNPEHPDAPLRLVDIRCGSSTEMELEAASLDAVLTDPPYYGMVQYGELMHFLYIWLRKLMGGDFVGLEAESTKHAGELTGNATEGRGIEQFAEGLATVYTRMSVALRPGAPLVFTYHHNKQEAYLAAGMAILDAGLTCTASLPCPAEMGGSIHISGTGSSIVDTVFVCRRNGDVPAQWIFNNAPELVTIMRSELTQLSSAGMKPTAGDIRCISYGHITRMAVANLRAGWDATLPTGEKLNAIKAAMNAIALLDDVRAGLEETAPTTSQTSRWPAVQQPLEFHNAATL
ncbi:MAG: DNA methylase [Comamonadaceae bacterium]|nr:DNA methylase [Comamonadaceae bacterium]